MLSPKKTKFRKMRKGRINGVASKNNRVAFGRYGLMAMRNHRLSSTQIEAARQAMTRHVKRGGKIWIRVFPHIVVTKKPLDVKMGKGKGNPEWYAARIKRGTVLFEMDGIGEDVAKEALGLAADKLPIPTKFVIREELEP